jgi:MFS family permease
MTYNIGVIIGPILGGILSDPAGTYPNLFGHVEFFRRFPYAAPNILSAFFLLCAVVGVWLCLEEVSIVIHSRFYSKPQLLNDPRLWILAWECVIWV